MNKLLIQDFDVAFCHRNTLLSKSIKTATGSKYSHTAHFRWIDSELHIYDAQKDGYRLRPFDEWMEEYGYEFDVLRLPNMSMKFMTEAATRELHIDGKKYDFVSLFIRKPRNIVVRVLNAVTLKKRPEWKQLPGHELNRVFCSEATAYVMQLPEVDLTPQQVYEQLKLRGWAMVPWRTDQLCEY